MRQVFPTYFFLSLMTGKDPATSAIATPSISGTGAANATLANPVIYKVVPMNS